MSIALIGQDRSWQQACRWCGHERNQHAPSYKHPERCFANVTYEGGVVDLCECTAFRS